jgi:hypothetical protein
MPDSFGVDPGGRYCVVGEDEIVKGLLMYCWAYEVRAGAAESARRDAERALERWVSLGLPFRCEQGRRLFDYWQVVNFMIWAGLNGKDAVFEARAAQTCRRSASGFLSPAQAPSAAGIHDPEDVTVLFRREFNLQSRAGGRQLRLRVPVPYEDRTQSQVSVELLEPAGVPCTQSPGRLEIRLPGTGAPERVVVEVRIRFTSSCESFAVDAGRLTAWDSSSAEFELYTRRSEGVIRVTESIVRLAESLTQSAGNVWEAVRAFWGFFFEHMKQGGIHHDELDPADPLGSMVRRGWCDCYTGSALLVALCRARGIPARLVNGLLLFPALPTEHYWLEVLLPPYGWLPLDPLSWNLAAGQIDQHPWSVFYLARLDQRMKSQCLPRLALGSAGVRFPPAWYQLPCLTEEGAETSYYELLTRQLLYRDRIQVCRKSRAGNETAQAPLRASHG